MEGEGRIPQGAAGISAHSGQLNSDDVWVVGLERGNKAHVRSLCKCVFVYVNVPEGWTSAYNSKWGNG